MRHTTIAEHIQGVVALLMLHKEAVFKIIHTLQGFFSLSDSIHSTITVVKKSLRFSSSIGRLVTVLDKPRNSQDSPWLAVDKHKVRHLHFLTAPYSIL
jgi:hypothetical protein